LSGFSRRSLTLAGGAAGLAAALPAAAARIRKPPPPAPPAPTAQPLPQFKTEALVAALDDGTQLYYVTASIGAPVIFVHGSLSDYSYWDAQLAPFAENYRVIAPSRRYNWPNQNPARRGYSAMVDAEDLARFIASLNAAPAHIIGHSYGAFAALFLAARHPQLVRTLTLAEPPAMSLLAHVPGDQAAAGAAMLKDVRTRMVAPMKKAFAKHDTEGGVRTFIDYVKGKPGTWDAFSDADKAATLKNAHEWEVIFAGGELFPELKPAEVARITAPVLMLSGAKSYPFLGLIDQALAALLPGAQHIVFPDATHQMWLEEPAACREAVFKLIDAHS
jgi:pimeloyl-ACP methyl ester carboxylesterase